MVKKNYTSGYQRKTARVLALEAAKKAKEQQNKKASDISLIRRTPKLKRLDEVESDLVSPTRQQEDEMMNRGKAILPNDQNIPAKGILEFVIDVLQRRDKHGYFAEPIDGDEVEDYYDFIKEPMDFGTMRAKLHEGIYITLKQFQDDVYRIFNNAMSFNSSRTTYFREARAIKELANKVFSTLETNPENIIKEFSNNKHCGRNSKYENEGSSSKRVNKGKRKRVERCQLSELANWASPNFNEAGWRHTYQPLTLTEETYISSPKKLVFANSGKTQEFSYEESLRRFVKNLGPVAKKVANQKLMILNQTRTSSQLEPSRYETQQHTNHEENVANFPNTPLTNFGTNNFSGFNSVTPSYVGPSSTVYPSVIVRESSNNLFKPSNNFSHMQQQLRNFLSQNTLMPPINLGTENASMPSINLGTENAYMPPINLSGTETAYMQPSNLLGTENSFMLPITLGTENAYMQPNNLLGTENSFIQPINLGTENAYMQSNNLLGTENSFIQPINLGTENAYMQPNNLMGTENSFMQPINLGTENAYMQSNNLLGTENSFMQPINLGTENAYMQPNNLLGTENSFIQPINLGTENAYMQQNNLLGTENSFIQPINLGTENAYMQPNNLLGTENTFMQPNNLLLGTENSNMHPINPLGTENSYLQPMNQYQGLQQLNFSQSQDLELGIHMTNPRF